MTDTETKRGALGDQEIIDGIHKILRAHKKQYVAPEIYDELTQALADTDSIPFEILQQMAHDFVEHLTLLENLDGQPLVGERDTHTQLDYGLGLFEVLLQKHPDLLIPTEEMLELYEDVRQTREKHSNPLMHVGPVYATPHDYYLNNIMRRFSLGKYPHLGQKRGIQLKLLEIILKHSPILSEKLFGRAHADPNFYLGSPTNNPDAPQLPINFLTASLMHRALIHANPEAAARHVPPADMLITHLRSGIWFDVQENNTYFVRTVPGHKPDVNPYPEKNIYNISALEAAKLITAYAEAGLQHEAGDREKIFLAACDLMQGTGFDFEASQELFEKLLPKIKLDNNIFRALNKRYAVLIGEILRRTTQEYHQNLTGSSEARQVKDSNILLQIATIESIIRPYIDIENDRTKANLLATLFGRATDDPQVKFTRYLQSAAQGVWCYTPKPTDDPRYEHEPRG